MKALIVGSGRVGGALSEQLPSYGYTSEFFTSRDSHRSFAQRIRRAQVVFIAIPTKGRGEIALQYIHAALALGNHVVITCEKAAIAYNYEQLARNPRFGYLATVGGGTGMLSLLRNTHQPISRVDAIVNGTLNFISSCAQEGCTIRRTLEDARQKGLCERNTTSLRKIFDTEMADVRLKMAILANEVCDTSITPDNLICTNTSEFPLPTLFRRGKRFVVSMTRKGTRTVGLGIHAKIDGWTLSGSFLTPAEIHARTPEDIPVIDIPRLHNNVMRVVFTNRSASSIQGPGAGPKETADRMIQEALSLLKKVK